MQEQGIQKLLEKARKDFRIPENVNYYSDEDYRLAERKFLQLCIIQGKCSTDNHHGGTGR
ncbi:MAG: hypothetical protein HKM93_19710 [Desulfobacteraceae bacterium]|nr:hypothetical protein [Desulfobacteraceae bacterium]